MLSQIPGYHFQVEAQRHIEAEAQRLDERYARLLAQQLASVDEFKRHKRLHPGDGPITWFNANAQWLNPIFAQVGAVSLAVDPTFIGAALVGLNAVIFVKAMYSLWKYNFHD